MLVVRQLGCSDAFLTCSRSILDFQCFRHYGVINIEQSLTVYNNSSAVKCWISSVLQEHGLLVCLLTGLSQLCVNENVYIVLIKFCEVHVIFTGRYQIKYTLEMFLGCVYLLSNHWWIQPPKNKLSKEPFTGLSRVLLF